MQPNTPHSCERPVSSLLIIVFTDSVFLLITVFVDSDEAISLTVLEYNCQKIKCNMYKKLFLSFLYLVLKEQVF